MEVRKNSMTNRNIREKVKGRQVKKGREENRKRERIRSRIGQSSKKIWIKVEGIKRGHFLHPI